MTLGAEAEVAEVVQLPEPVPYAAEAVCGGC